MSDHFIRRYIEVIESWIPSLSDLTEKEKIYIINVISNALRYINDQCVDNWRMALEGDEESETEYNKRRESGCCGFYDDKIKLKRGITILFGFNYGH